RKHGELGGSAKCPFRRGASIVGYDHSGFTLSVVRNDQHRSCDGSQKPVHRYRAVVILTPRISEIAHDEKIDGTRACGDDLFRQPAQTQDPSFDFCPLALLLKFLEQLERLVLDLLLLFSERLRRQGLRDQWLSGEILHDRRSERILKKPGLILDKQT